MTLEEALNQIKENSHLIGLKIAMGTIDELVVYPKNDNSKIAYKDIYYKTLDSKKAILPFINEDLSVSAIIDKKRIKQGFFFTSSIEDVIKELEK